MSVSKAAKSAILALGALLALGEASARAQDQPAPSTAARWLTPEASPDRVAFDAGAGFVPSDSAWLLLNAELDHESGFIARSTFSLDVRDPERPREAFGSLSLGYRWRGRYELGLSGLVAAGPGLQRVWAGGPGAFVGLGTPEGLRLTLTVFGMVIGSLDPQGRTSALALPYDLQVPVLVRDRVRLFVVNRGVFTFSTPEVFVHRAELHALLANRWRLFGGALIDRDGVGAIFGAGLRFGEP